VTARVNSGELSEMPRILGVPEVPYCNMLRCDGALKAVFQLLGVTAQGS